MSTKKLCAKWAVPLAVAAIVLSSAYEIAAETIDGQFERTLAVGGDTLALDVRTGSGRIEVTVGEPGSVRVTGRIRGHGSKWTADGAAVVEDRVRAIETDPVLCQNSALLK